APRALALGLGAALILIPAILSLNDLVVRLYGLLVKVPTQQHALVQLTRTPLLPFEWVFWVIVAVVIAPVLEEILFRCAVQGYVLARPLGGYIVVVLAILIAYAGSTEAIQAASPAAIDQLDAYMPVLFMLVLGLGFLATREYAPETTLSAVFASS